MNFSLPVDVNIGPTERQATGPCPPARTDLGSPGDRSGTIFRKNQGNTELSRARRLARRVLLTRVGFEGPRGVSHETKRPKTRHAGHDPGPFLAHRKSVLGPDRGSLCLRRRIRVGGFRQGDLPGKRGHDSPCLRRPGSSSGLRGRSQLPGIPRRRTADRRASARRSSGGQWFLDPCRPGLRRDVPEPARPLRRVPGQHGAAVGGGDPARHHTPGRGRGIPNRHTEFIDLLPG